MKKKRPYLLNAMWDWINDSGYTPHIIVDTTVGNCVVPEGYTNEEGKIVLNVGPGAAKNLSIGDEVTFKASFNRQAFHIVVPVGSVVGIYVKENGQGMIFAPVEEEEKPAFTPTKYPHLQVVK